MPTPIPIHRTYCKSCKSFTIHTADYICQNCNTEYTPYLPSDVDTEMIQQQRERYKKQKQQETLGIYSAWLQGNGLQQIMHDFDNPKIIECDAGQKEIDNNRKERINKAKLIIKAKQDDYNTNYKHLNRNNKCSCGSGKKFKQCHLIEFREFLNI